MFGFIGRRVAAVFKGYSANVNEVQPAANVDSIQFKDANAEKTWNLYVDYATAEADPRYIGYGKRTAINDRPIRVANFAKDWAERMQREMAAGRPLSEITERARDDAARAEAVDKAEPLGVKDYDFARHLLCAA
jgi:hypothetical protein